MMGVCYAMYLYIRDVDNMLRGEHTSSSATLAELEALPRPYIDPKYQMQRINIWPSLSPPRTYRQRMFFRNGKCRWPRLYFQQPTNWRRRHSRCVRYVHFLYGYKWACVRRATRKWAGWNVEMATEILDIFYIEIIRIVGIFDLVILVADCISQYIVEVEPMYDVRVTMMILNVVQALTGSGVIEQYYNTTLTWWKIYYINWQFYQSPQILLNEQSSAARFHQLTEDRQPRSF